VLFAAAASPTEHGASHVILRLGAATLLDCVSSEQAVTEVERNIARKRPDSLAKLRAVVRAGLRVVPDPTVDELIPYRGQADEQDLPILVAAVLHGCDYLLTFNVRHFDPAPGLIVVARPGDFLVSLRNVLARLRSDRPEQGN
jgi:hypothetical protein